MKFPQVDAIYYTTKYDKNINTGDQHKLQPAHFLTINTL